MIVPITDLSVMGRVVEVLSRHRFRLETEKKTQADIDAALVKAFDQRMFTFEREVAIYGGIIDFVVTGLEPSPPPLRSMSKKIIGIEVKLKGQPLAIKRQLMGYASEPSLSGLILATAKPVNIPALLGVVPVRVVNLGKAWL